MMTQLYPAFFMHWKLVVVKAPARSKPNVQYTPDTANSAKRTRLRYFINIIRIASNNTYKSITYKYQLSIKVLQFIFIRHELVVPLQKDCQKQELKNKQISLTPLILKVITPKNSNYYINHLKTPNLTKTQTMLHQLLFALIGKPGTIIRSDNKGFMVDRSLSMFKDHEITLLNQIVQVGYNYRLLAHFIQSETCLIDYSVTQARREPSVYRQTLAIGLEKYLSTYLTLIHSIQQNFLQSKHFTLSNIKSQLTKYQFLFPQLLQMINTIISNNMRGGVIVDYVYQRYKIGNIWLREVLQTILKQFYHTLINQIIAWLMYGEIIDKNMEFFVHRVTFQPTHKFKFNNKNVRQVDITDWEMYTIQTSMIPTCFIKEEIAGKILFIGKSTKILKNCQKISILPSKQSLEQAKILQNTNYDSNQLQQIIEQVRYNVANKMTNLIMQQQNFLKQLYKVNEYYMMTKGDFYQLLLDQSKDIDKVAQKQKAQKKLNQQYLQNTFMRLNSFEDTKKIAFQLRPLGFNFHGFKTFNQLCPVGNIDLIDGKAVRFNGSDGALWHKTKQLVENDFHMGFVFKFKKYPKFFKSDTRQDARTNNKAVISVVIQNCQQVLPNSHTNPYNLKFIEEYISINVGFVSNEKQTQFGCFMSIIAQDKKTGKSILLGDKKIQKINLMDENQYHLKISYRENNKENNFKVSLGTPNSSYSYDNNQINVDVSLPFYVNLQMGRANVGFISNLLGSNYCAEVDEWQMLCTAPNHYGDHWSDLCLSYKTSWPLDLVLTPDLLDNFSRAHKFLFPMRQTQIQLDQIWKAIPRRMKHQKQQKFNSKTSKAQLLMFQRRISSFRAKISMVISQLWKYFQSDVIQTTFQKLKESLSKIDDFQNLIKMVNKYIKSIQTMFFFNVPKIQKIINQIIKHCKQFIHYFKKVEDEKIDEFTFSKLEEMKDSFDDILNMFVNTLKDLAVISSSQYLSQLSQRMLECVCQTGGFRSY